MKQENVSTAEKPSARLKNPKTKKALGIIAPCAVLLAVALILIPSFSRMADQIKAQPMAAHVHTNLYASSTENDLYITVCDDEGQAVTGEIFSLTIGYPDGQLYSFDTETDGSCYLIQLEAGEYSIRMSEREDYISADPITYQVTEKTSDAYMDGAGEYAEIKDAAEVSQGNGAVPDAAGDGEDPDSVMGWREVDGRLYYYDDDGNMAIGLKKIDGRIYYFDKNGVRASSVGIDVSYYDKDIDWKAVKDQGIDFAIIRVGGRTWQAGYIYYDSSTVENFTQAKQAGLKVGAYFYSTAITPMEAIQEAIVTLDVLNGVSLDFPVYFDTEYSGMAPKGRADMLDKAQRTEIIRAFCETINNLSHYTAGVYSGEYFIKNNLDYSSISQYNIWMASYTSDNNLPRFNGRYDIWQFTDSGVLDGIKGYVDMNVIF